MRAGQLVAGRYRVKSPIGEGAMASVWRAADETLQREVAIKFLYTKGTRDPSAMVDQFLREARIAASVQHRNVIHTVDFGAIDDEQPFMVMELLNGETLAERMQRDPPLERAQIVHLVTLTLRGLAAVHDAGIVHRDLKPANIFLQRDAEAIYPKILDFGISRSLRQGTELPSAIATQDGMIVGTPDYMAPEQARGETDIDKRADIYSMGVILYRGLTGKLPFVADTIGDLLVQIVTSTAPTVRDVCPDVPPSLSAVVAQSMTRNREDRFADARAMRRALRSATGETSMSGRRAAPADAPRSGDSHPRAAAAAIPASPKPSAKPATAHGDGWGDFEGLAVRRERTPTPPPKIAPAPAPTPAPPAPAPALKVEDAPRPAAETPAASPTQGASPTTSGGPPSMSEMLNPLYKGKDLPALDIDYDLVRADRGKDRLPVLESAPRSARAPSAARAKAPARQAAREAPGPQRARSPRSGGGARLWLLALAALALAIYLLARPAGDVGPPKVESRGLDARPLVKMRRANVKGAPPHLRDVRF